MSTDVYRLVLGLTCTVLCPSRRQLLTACRHEAGPALWSCPSLHLEKNKTCMLNMPEGLWCCAPARRTCSTRTGSKRPLGFCYPTCPQSCLHPHKNINPYQKLPHQIHSSPGYKYYFWRLRLWDEGLSTTTTSPQWASASFVLLSAQTTDF